VIDPLGNLNFRSLFVHFIKWLRPGWYQVPARTGTCAHIEFPFPYSEFQNKSRHRKQVSPLYHLSKTASDAVRLRLRCRVCLLLQYLIQSCARGGRRIVEDMCYEIRRAEACVD
jgi:hypothetical protein